MVSKTKLSAEEEAHLEAIYTSNQLFSHKAAA